MKSISGDLLAMAMNGFFDVIVHGCNCHCVMGAGIAKQIKMIFPEAYAADLGTDPGDKGKLGDFTHALVSHNGNDFVIVNGYTQYDYKRKGNECMVDYDAIRSVFRGVKQEFAGQRIGYPMIGAGLGGGDWDTIKQIIEEELEGEDHCLVVYDK